MSLSQLPAELMFNILEDTDDNTLRVCRTVRICPSSTIAEIDRSLGVSWPPSPHLQLPPLPISNRSRFYRLPGCTHVRSHHARAICQIASPLCCLVKARMDGTRVLPRHALGFLWHLGWRMG